MLGDVLKKNLVRLKNSSTNIWDDNAFWLILKNIAVEEIVEYKEAVDSDIIIPIYYEICCKNLSFIPEYYQKILPSNKQERFRVIIRNMFSSNAFHTEGLANHPLISAHKEINPNKKGSKIVFKFKGE